MTLPIAIFAFNRPDSLRSLLATLSACPEFPDAAVTIFIDGPRSPAEAALVAETLAVARSAAAPHWVIRPRESNLGLRASIMAGVTEVCRTHGRVVVFEDDIEVSPVALTYFSQALDRYENEDRVWSISGYGFHGSDLDRENRAFFLPFAHPWGWATWQRAWTRFEDSDQPVPAALLKSPSFRTAFNVMGLSDMSSLTDLAQRGLINSWYVRWCYKIFCEGGVSLFPTRNLVGNTGLAGGGTHAGRLNPYGLLIGTIPPLAQETPAWPKAVTIDYLALDRMTRSKDARIQRFIIRMGRYKRLLKQLAGRLRGGAR